VFGLQDEALLEKLSISKVPRKS